MKCPICDNHMAVDVLRCPNCNSPLTVWKNLDGYAEQAYAAGLELVSRGESMAALELFCRSITFAPTEPRYLDTYGRLLARLGRYAEAIVALKNAHRLNRSEETKAALERVQNLAKASTTSPEGRLKRSPLALGRIALIEAISGETAAVKSWYLCFAIEDHWRLFSQFSDVLAWNLQSGDGVGGPLAYLRGVNAYTSGDDDEARRCFELAIDSQCPFGNADVYLLVLSAGNGLGRMVDVLASKGRTREQVAHTLRLAADMMTKQQPMLEHNLLTHAVRHAGDDREQLGRRLVKACQTREQGEAACRVLEECVVERPSIELQLLLGDLKWRLAGTVEAERVYRGIANQYPKAWQPRLRLADVYATTDTTRALEYLNGALEPPDIAKEGIIALRSRRLQILYDSRQWESALEDARVLCKLCPNRSDFATIAAECESKCAGDGSSEDGHCSADSKGDGDRTSTNS